MGHLKGEGPLAPDINQTASCDPTGFVWNIGVGKAFLSVQEHPKLLGLARPTNHTTGQVLAVGAQE
jgi:hypothetical protein